MLDMEPSMYLDDELLAVFALHALGLAGNKMRPLCAFLLVACAFAILPAFLGVFFFKTHGCHPPSVFFIVNPKSGEKANIMRFSAVVAGGYCVIYPLLFTKNRYIIRESVANYL